MRFYLVEMTCPRCGQLHRITSGLILEGGPTRAGSLAELYGTAPLPWGIMDTVESKVYCERDKQYTQPQDRRTVFLTPLGEA